MRVCYLQANRFGYSPDYNRKAAKHLPVLFGEPRRRSFRVKSLSSEWWEIVALSNRLTGHDWKGGGLEIAKIMLVLGKISPELPESDQNKAKLALVTLGNEQDSFQEVEPATTKPESQESRADTFGIGSLSISSQ